MRWDEVRLSREQAMMDTAYIWADRSTCSRLHVGSVIHREGRILVQGYNGAPAGMPHCNHECDCNRRQVMSLPNLMHDSECASMQPCKIAVHAEQNAISFAARWGVGLEGAAMSVTHQPCYTCAQTIINSGITLVMYQEPYRLREGLELLIEAGIEIGVGLWVQRSSTDRINR